MSARGQTRLKELASELGLSITTVSRALAGYSDVSPATRERVREAADRMGYVPSRAARMLVSGRSDFIGMMLPVRHGRAIDAFLGEFVTGLSQGLAEQGRDLFLATVAPNQGEVEVLGHIIDSRRADALVLNRSYIDDPRASYLLDRKFPFVVHGRLLHESRPYVWLDTDGERAFADAVRMLADLGHRDFGLLTVAEPYSFAHLRQRGMTRALAELGLELPDAAVAAAPMADGRAALQGAMRLLACEPRPTAILCVIDALALAVLEAARQSGITVPDDLSVIGFDNIPVAGFADPPLSTFDQRLPESMALIARMVLNVIEKGAGAVEPQLITPEFVARGSHGPAPRSRRKTVVSAVGDDVGSDVGRTIRGRSR